ncbi:MAG: FAD-dependent oxidoreductase, partial [Candidatus Bathyarchaeia archaeon]
GTDECIKILHRIKQFLNKKGVEIRTNTEVKGLLVKNGKVEGVKTAKGEEIFGKYIIVAPGRGGAEWLASEAQLLGLKKLNNPVDIGVRVEVPAPVLEELTNVLYEPKFVFFSKFFDDKVRVFCVCPYGEVITESYNDVITVNGQSYAKERSENTNFAILVSTSFTEPFKEPIAYGKYIARLANLLSGGVILQRVGDLESGRRSTFERIARNLVKPTLKLATPGDLSFVLPYRYLANIREMLKALDKVSPGVYSKHTLLYGVEVKFYSSRLELNNAFETKIKNLFAIGDGAGITRGLVQASVSGVLAAREITKKENK